MILISFYCYSELALNLRKRCLRCATRAFKSVLKPYEFDSMNDICGKLIYWYQFISFFDSYPNFLENKIGTSKRAFCECDLQFVKAISKNMLNQSNKNYPAERCQVSISIINSYFNLNGMRHFATLSAKRHLPRKSSLRRKSVTFPKKSVDLSDVKSHQVTLL